MVKCYGGLTYVKNIQPRYTWMLCLLALLLAYWRAPEITPAYFEKIDRPPVDVRQDNNPSSSSELLPVPEDWRQKTYSAHSVTLAALPKDKVAAAWFAGSREGSEDVHIWFSRREQNEWSAPLAVIDRVGLQVASGRMIRKLGNPVLHYESARQRLHLFVVSVSLGGWAGSALNHFYSDDEGHSWSTPQRLVLSPFFNISTLVRTAPLPLANGGLGLPAYHEFIAKSGLWVRLQLDVDRARVISLSRLPEPRRSLQPAVVALDRQRALALLRDSGRGMGQVRAVMSDDGGQLWQDAADLSLGNPDASVALLDLSNGHLLLAANPASGRGKLELWGSSDQGLNWRRLKVVERDESGEFSYPALLQDDDGYIHLAYTWRRQGIRYMRFNEAWLLADIKPDAGS